MPAAIRRASGTLMPLPADQVVEGMRAYQRLWRDLLEPSDWPGGAPERRTVELAGGTAMPWVATAGKGRSLGV